MIPEWIWPLVSAIVSVIILPVVALIVNRNEKKAAQRAEANERFNNYMLWGIKAVGGLAKANTISIKRGEPNGEMEEALSEYNRFHKEITKFTSGQAVKTF